MNLLITLLFVTFGVFYVGNLILIKRKEGVKAFVLGKNKKDIEVYVKASTGIWCVTWLYYGIFGTYLSNIWTVLGVILLILGVSLFIGSMVSMGNSWRVGVDEQTTTALVNKGLFKISRNPTFLGFDLMFFGLLFVQFNVYTIILIAINVAGFHFLILKEEKYLEDTHKEDYRNYKKSVPRYLFFL